MSGETDRFSMLSNFISAMAQAKSGPLRASMEIATSVVLFGTIAVSTTVGLGLASSWYDEQRILCSIALCVAAVGALLSGSRIENGAGRLLILVALIGLVSALRSSRPSAALCD